MCNRHCTALFKKQLFPVLFNPVPTLALFGHVVSTGLVYKVVVLLFTGGTGEDGLVLKGVIRAADVFDAP